MWHLAVVTGPLVIEHARDLLAQAAEERHLGVQLRHARLEEAPSPTTRAYPLLAGLDQPADVLQSQSQTLGTLDGPDPLNGFRAI